MLSSRWHSWQPELRRAMMRVRPEYFGWSRQEQERYGVDIPDEHYWLLRRMLLAERSPRRRPEDVLLAVVGIGEDNFHCDDPLDDGRTILDLTTLRQFDEADYQAQEELRKCERADYVPKPYCGSLYLRSAQLHLDGQFAYAKLSMAAGYVYSQLCDASHDLIEACIPYRYVPGKNHGKVKGKFWQWDMRVEAHGLENVVEELQQRVWNYERERLDALLTNEDQANRSCAYLIDESTPGVAGLHFVFSDKGALNRVCFRSFVRDCRGMQRPATELAETVDEEKQLLSHFIAEQYAQIISDDRANVTRFRQIPRVAMLGKHARTA